MSQEKAMTVHVSIDALIQHRSPQAIRRSLLTLTDEHKATACQKISDMMGDADLGERIFNDIIISVEKMDLLEDDIIGTIFKAWDDDDIFDQVSDTDKENAINDLLLRADHVNPMTDGLSHERAKTVSRYDEVLGMLMTYVYDEDEYYQERSYAVDEIRTSLAEYDELFPTIDKEDQAIFQIVNAMADPTYRSDEEAIVSLMDDDKNIQAALRGAARTVLTQSDKSVDPDTWL